MKILRRKKQKLEVGQKGQNTRGNYGITPFLMTAIVSGTFHRMMLQYPTTFKLFQGSEENPYT